MDDIDDNLMEEVPTSKKRPQKKKRTNVTHIRENPEEIVDLADMRMIGNVISKNYSSVLHNYFYSFPYI